MNIMKFKRTFAIFLILIIGVLPIKSAFSVGSAITGFASETTQLMNNVQLSGVLIQEIENIQEQIKQHKTMLKNLKNLQNFNALRYEITETLSDLENAVRFGEALSYANVNIDESFRDKYRGYDSFHNDLASRDFRNEGVFDVYKGWQKTNHDGVIGALKAANIQSSQLSGETALVSSIMSRLNSAEGALQALQAGAAIGAHQVDQLQKLRQLTMAQMQMQANYIAMRTDEMAIRKANKEKAIHREVPLIDTPQTTSSDDAKW